MLFDWLVAWAYFAHNWHDSGRLYEQGCLAHRYLKRWFGVTRPLDDVVMSPRAKAYYDRLKENHVKKSLP